MAAAAAVVALVGAAAEVAEDSVVVAGAEILVGEAGVPLVVSPEAVGRGPQVERGLPWAVRRR